MTEKNGLTASSCVVQHDGDKIRLTIHFMNFGEYHRVKSLFEGDEAFKIDQTDPRNGGSIGGSRLVVELSDVFASHASTMLSKIKFRRDAEKPAPAEFMPPAHH